MKQERLESAKIEVTNRVMKSHKEIITPCQNQSEARRLMSLFGILLNDQFFHFFPQFRP